MKLETKRVVSAGAEKFIQSPINILDHGFVYLVDYMGDDLSIEEAARVSYGPGTEKVSDSTGLINYLMRNKHTSPFEMVELKFHLKMPIFVARQWIRHRTASLNEISGRYSVLPSEFYIPNKFDIAFQSESNNQGRGEQISDELGSQIQELIFTNSDKAYFNYEELIIENVARELARTVLPVNIYTEMYWKIDLHNLFHFLKLRLDHHAQWEIRQYADALAIIVKSGWPLAWSAFEDYVLNSITFSHQELKVLNDMLENGGVLREGPHYSKLSKREQREFIGKLDKIGEINGS